MELSRKQVSVTGVKAVDANQGIVEAFVSVTNVKDSVSDIIEPGAYAITLATRRPKGVWAHDTTKTVAKTLMAEELMPGDPRLPERIQSLGGGALIVRAQFNLDTQRGREAFSDVKFYGDEQEWSIGYQVPAGGQQYDDVAGANRIKRLDLYEFSPVIFGAAPATATASVKSADIAAASEDANATEIEVDADLDIGAEEDKEETAASDDADETVDPTVLAIVDDVLERIGEKSGVRVKQGRVLSAANEERLMEAANLIAEVLSEVTGDAAPTPTEVVFEFAAGKSERQPLTADMLASWQQLIVS